MSITEEKFSILRDGLTIRGRVFRGAGAGKMPAAILCHGFGGIMADTENYAKCFAEKGFCAYTFDFCGGSPRSTSDGAFTAMTPFTEVADLEAVMAHAAKDPSWNGTYTLLGCSQGGFVCAMEAAKAPEKIAKLVLFFPALCIPEDARRGNMLAYVFDPENIPESVPATAMEDFFSEPLGRCYPESVMGLDTYEIIPAYRGPVLIVHGDADGVVNLSYSRRAQECYADCQLEVIPGGGHGFDGEKDTQAIACLREFI